MGLISEVLFYGRQTNLIEWSGMLTWQISNRTLSPTLGGLSQSFKKYIIVFLVLAWVYVITPPSVRS